MSSALVRALYRSLLDSAKQLERNSVAGHSLYNAIRSGAIESYDGVKADWQRERRYENRLHDAKAVQMWSKRPVTAAMLVRTQFEMPLDNPNSLHQRLDSAFQVLRDIDDHNALVRDLIAQGVFKPKRRSKSVKFRVGDIVEVNELGVGVIVAWTEARAHAFGELHVTYEVLPDTSYHSGGERLHRVPQSQIRHVDEAKPVQHPSVLVYFDGFAIGRHVPCPALAQKYPDDASGYAVVDKRESDWVFPAPSILQLQSADEDKLVQYLRCDDNTVIHFASAALEGMWMSECGDHAQREVQIAARQIDSGDVAGAKQTLANLLETTPSFAYGWSKLGSVELKSGNFTSALKHYERATQLKPQMLDAWAGLGTCATRLRRWNVAHTAAMRLLSVQPHNETARLLLDNAILSSL